MCIPFGLESILELQYLWRWLRMDTTEVMKHPGLFRRWNSWETQCGSSVAHSSMIVSNHYCRIPVSTLSPPRLHVFQFRCPEYIYRLPYRPHGDTVLTPKPCCVRVKHGNVCISFCRYMYIHVHVTCQIRLSASTRSWIRRLEKLTFTKLLKYPLPQPP